jgi:hypothetical protein
MYAESSDRRVKSLEDLIRVAEIDLDRWIIERHIINKWETGAANDDGGIVVEPMWQVKAWLKPIDPYSRVKEIVEDLKEDMKDYAPPEYIRSTIVEADHCVEINIADIHFGMYAWHEDAGDNWDSEIASGVFMDAITTLKSKADAAFGAEIYLLPVGNDLLHVDNTIDGKGGMTTKGTPQDVDSRYPKMYREARRMVVDAVNILAEDALVFVYVIPGNHDQERMFCLGDSLECWFREDDRVNINNTATPRKYFKYGVNLIGFAHGHNEKVAHLPQIMAQEVPHLWADSLYREWHIGHKHTKKETLFSPLVDVDGVRIREFPSLVPNDSWHESKGYLHTRSSEALIFHHENGLAGTFAYNILK